jgi:hypothetical protein
MMGKVLVMKHELIKLLTVAAWTNSLGAYLFAA